MQTSLFCLPPWSSVSGTAFVYVAKLIGVKIIEHVLTSARFTGVSCLDQTLGNWYLNHSTVWACLNHWRCSLLEVYHFVICSKYNYTTVLLDNINKGDPSISNHFYPDILQINECIKSIYISKYLGSIFKKIITMYSNLKIEIFNVTLTFIKWLQS